MRRAVLATLLAACVAAVAAATGAERAPEFTHAQASEWINSSPLTLAGLRGRVVLVEFWAFGCSNCRNTLPWLQAADARYRDRGLTVVGVHAPEFPNERDAANVREAVRLLNIRHAVVLDNDFSTWKAYGNRYWPAFYLIDRQGRVRATAIGELHAGEGRADDFEATLRRLLAEDPPA